MANISNRSLITFSIERLLQPNSSPEKKVKHEEKDDINIEDSDEDNRSFSSEDSTCNLIKEQNIFERLHRTLSQQDTTKRIEQDELNLTERLAGKF